MMYQQYLENSLIKKGRNMSFHIMYDHQCLKCEAYYIPYKKGIVCPYCGLNEEEI